MLITSIMIEGLSLGGGGCSGTAVFYEEFDDLRGQLIETSQP